MVSLSRRTRVESSQVMAANCQRFTLVELSSPQLLSALMRLYDLDPVDTHRDAWPGQGNNVPILANMTTDQDYVYIDAVNAASKTYMAPVSAWCEWNLRTRLDTCPTLVPCPPQRSALPAPPQPTTPLQLSTPYECTYPCPLFRCCACLGVDANGTKRADADPVYP
jgi:hypothetical protein